jgi:hypothetical protein
MKYHPQQIQAMAVQFVMAEAFGDARASEVVARLCEDQNISPEECRAKIHQLAITNLQPMEA